MCTSLDFRVFSIFAFLAFAGGSAFESIVIALAIFLQAIRFLAIACALRYFSLQIWAKSKFVVTVIFTPHALTVLVAPPS